MKNLILCFILLIGIPVFAHCNRSSCSHVYVVRSDVSQEERIFANCKKHYLKTETTTNYYSNGTKRVFNNHTIMNSDGSIVAQGFSNVKHVIKDDKHYFLVRKGKVYKILNDTGIDLTQRQYTYMEEISPEKLLVKSDKKYGIIDLNEKIIVPIKYKKFVRNGTDLYLTELNGFYGLLDSSNNVIIKNEYDKIKRVYDIFILKQYNKFGLADINGKIIIPAQVDSIKKLGEYIIVKNNKKYGVYSNDGKALSPIIYKKIRLERNKLEGTINGKVWVEISNI